MAVALPGGGFGFWLKPEDVAPAAYATAPKAAQLRFLRDIAGPAADVWRKYRRQGIDANGQPMKPIHPLTRRARADNINPVSGKRPYSPMGMSDPNNAPLQASGSKSRTTTLLRSRPVLGKGVWFYWLTDRHTGRPWGEILNHHRKGFARFFVYPSRGWGYVKSRDVFGFSAVELGEIKDLAVEIWREAQPDVLPTLTRVWRVAADQSGIGPCPPVRPCGIGKRSSGCRWPCKRSYRRRSRPVWRGRSGRSRGSCWVGRACMCSP
jgi:hypothetical protein